MMASVNGAKITEETGLVDGDQILIGQTTLLFTEKDFDDRESALSHFKKVGERMRPTRIDYTDQMGGPKSNDKSW